MPPIMARTTQNVNWFLVWEWDTACTSRHMLFPLDISENFVIIGVVMAQKGKKTPAAIAGSGKADVGLPFGKTNMILFAFGLLSVILGFITLASGSEMLAPILLVLGYCVIIPVSIIWKDKGKRGE